MTRDGARIFKLKRGGLTTSNSGPSGWKLKRKWRPYTNAKLQRKGISLVWQGQKGTKQLGA